MLITRIAFEFHQEKCSKLMNSKDHVDTRFTSFFVFALRQSQLKNFTIFLEKCAKLRLIHTNGQKYCNFISL